MAVLEALQRFAWNVRTFLTRAFPGLPFLRGVSPEPPEVEVESPSLAALSNSGIVALLGAIGVAVTPLTPVGKAQFGAQFIDVIAEAACVSPGARVQVVELDGERIVVREV